MRHFFNSSHADSKAQTSTRKSNKKTALESLSDGSVDSTGGGVAESPVSDDGKHGLVTQKGSRTRALLPKSKLDSAGNRGDSKGLVTLNTDSSERGAALSSRVSRNKSGVASSVEGTCISKHLQIHVRVH